MNFTPAQEKVICENKKSLLVSAAAGSGKTSVLVAKVMKLIESGADVSRMLIVTFTNAAAGEMKERISSTLGADSVRHSHICTFHKFAIDVIQKYYHIIGVNPSFAICDEYRQSIFKNEALDEMFEELFNKEDPDFTDFLNCYATEKSSQAVKDMVLELSTFVESLPSREEFLESIKEGSFFDEKIYADYAVEIVKASLEGYINSLSAANALLLNPDVPGAKPMPKLSAKVLEDIEGLRSLLDAVNADGIDAFKKLEDFSFMRMAQTNDEKPSFALVRDKFEVLREAATKPMKKLTEDFGSVSKDTLKKEKEALKKPLTKLAFLTSDFSKRYQEKKVKNRLVDFSDIEHYALDILKNEEVCNELRDSFEYIFVDEYQDSNLVQDKLISLIAREDNVFLVGDVKQSIYKFRLAEPELFLARYDLYRSGKLSSAMAIDLNSNFRSKKPILDFINHIFERLMTRKSVGLDYDEDAALNEGEKYTGDKLFKPVLNLVSTNASEDEELDSEIEELKDAEIEALSAVKTIKEYYGKTIYDVKTKVERPLDYKDMVILLRSTKSKGEIYYKALEDAGIPVYLERGEGYFDTPEIQVLINLLRIIDNFRQDIALIGVLHFPSFGFSTVDLANIRIFSKEMGKADLSFADAFMLYVNEASGELKERCKAFLDRLEEYRIKSKAMPLADFIWDILSDSSIGIFARALPLGSQRYANLRALADKAEDYEKQNGGGLFGFIHYIELISKGDKAVKTGQVTVLSEGANTVRIMTIHKSKGLEFPFVLLAGLSSKFMSSKNSLHLGLHKSLGASIRLVEPLKGLYVDPLSLSLINYKKKEEDFAETIRVLYVAMTRAKDILILSATTKDANEWMAKRNLLTDAFSCKNYLDMIGPSLGVTDINVISLADINMALAPVGSEKEILAALDKGFVVDKAGLPISEEELKERIFFDYSPKPEDLLKHKYSVSEITQLERNVHPENRVKRNYKVPNFAKAGVVIDAAARGSAYHKVMEHIPFTAEKKTPADIAEFIQNLKERNLLSEEECLAVDASKISAFFESEIGKRAIEAKVKYKEKSFILKTMFEGREVLVQGTIDCYFEEDGKYVLLDYKSNYIDIEKLEEERQRLLDSYIPQLKLYKEALEVITGKSVKEAVLYLFGINDIIKVC